MKTISKGKFLTVTVTVSDERLRQMKESQGLATRAMEKAVEYWHTKVLPEHFKSQAHFKYGFAGRGRNYLQSAGKRGKPDMVLSGTLRNDLTSGGQFKQGSTGIELRMSARVLNLAPAMPENSADLYVKHKRGRGFPNLKREIKLVLDDEREALAQIVCNELEKYFGDTAGRESDD